MALLERSANLFSIHLSSTGVICIFAYHFKTLFIYYSSAVSSNACTVSVNHPSLGHLYVIVSQNIHSCLSLSSCPSLVCAFHPTPDPSMYLCLPPLSLCQYAPLHTKHHINQTFIVGIRRRPPPNPRLSNQNPPQLSRQRLDQTSP